MGFWYPNIAIYPKGVYPDLWQWHGEGVSRREALSRCTGSPHCRRNYEVLQSYGARLLMQSYPGGRRAMEQVLHKR